MSHCCPGTATWFCCYPDSCGCDCSGCQNPSSCSNPICYPYRASNGNVCNRSPVCGGNPPVITKAACCTCNSGQWGFAWPYCGQCGMCPSCNTNSAYLLFTKGCSLYDDAPRVDTGPGSGALVDLTKALFMDFAPLSQGMITGMKVMDYATCC